MVSNSGMKHESETMLEVIRDLVLDFVLYFVTVCQSTHVHVTFALYP